MKKFCLFLLLLLFSKNSFAEDNKNEIRKFLFTNPAQVDFKSANKFLPKPFFKKSDWTWVGGKEDKYDALQSNFVDINSGKAQYNILKSKIDGHYLYGMLVSEPKDCESFIEIVRDSYGKDFVFNITDNVTLFGKKGKQVEGSIDIQNWRAGLYCYEEESEGNFDIFSATITLGGKKYVNQIPARQKIDCSMENGNQIVYQIDNAQKSLLSINNISWGESTIFNDDFIEVEGTKLKIKIDRKSGKLTITSQENNSIRIFGSCEKRGAEKKF